MREHPRQTLRASFACAFAGLGRFVRERNSRIQMACGGLAVLSGVVLRVSRVDWLVLLLTIAVVLGLEGMNCAIERVVDLASPDYHPLARDAKDYAAGAVLLASIVAVVIGGLVFGPYVIALVRPWG